MKTELKTDIRAVRGYEKKTQQWVGDQIGVPASRVHNIENNMNIVNFKTITDIFKVLGYEVCIRKIEND